MAIGPVLALGVSALVTFGVLRVLRRTGHYDLPTARSSHTLPTVRGGGIGVAVGAIVGLLAVSADFSHGPTVGLALAAVAFGAIGLVDDLSPGVPVAVRLGLQALVAAVSMPFVLAQVSGPDWWQVLLAIGVAAWLSAFVNIFNFMDGINGISALQAVVAGGALALLGSHVGDDLVRDGGLIIAAAAIGFLPFNFPRARIFLGDVGSYFVGGWLAVLVVLALRSGVPAEAALAPFALYLADTSITLVRRIRRGARWQASHHEHSYQRLIDLGWSHRRTAGLVAALSAACAGLGALSLSPAAELRVSADVVILVVVGFYLWLPARLGHRVGATTPVVPVRVAGNGASLSAAGSALRVICVAAARPNLMKIKPVIDALEAHGTEVTFVHTGQHYDESMSGVFFDDLGLRNPDKWLAVGSGTHGEQTARVIEKFEPVVADLQPDVVVVVGDVNSTLACALVAAKAGALVAHVEAGLRSRDWGMPEEINRVVTDRLSDYLFATSASAVDNLRDEGYRADQIHLVGNVMVDTLFANHERALERPILHTLELRPGEYGLVTLHRPGNVDDPATLGRLLAALERISAELPLVFPVHPRTRVQLAPHRLGHGVRLIDPLGYLDFLALQAQARLVLTDSGGVQEETTVLGVPCLTMRETTERPTTVVEGTNQLVGRDPDRIVHAVRHVLAEGWPARRPALWDGHAAERIAALLVSDAPTRRLRPTDRPDLWQPSVTPVVRSSASSL